MQCAACCSPPARSSSERRDAAQARVRYEQIIIDSNYKRFRRRFKLFTRRRSSTFPDGRARSRSRRCRKHYKTQLDPFADKMTVTDGGFTVVHTRDNTRFSAPSYFIQRSAGAASTSRSRSPPDPALHDALHVIPQFEA